MVLWTMQYTLGCSSYKKSISNQWNVCSISFNASFLHQTMTVSKQVSQTLADWAFAPLNHSVTFLLTSSFNQSNHQSDGPLSFLYWSGKWAPEQWRHIHHIYTNCIYHDYACHREEMKDRLMGTAQPGLGFFQQYIPWVLTLESHQ